MLRGLRRRRKRRGWSCLKHDKGGEEETQGEAEKTGICRVTFSGRNPCIKIHV